MGCNFFFLSDVGSTGLIVNFDRVLKGRYDEVI